MDVKINVFVVLVALIVLLFPKISEGILQRCYSCRSRGELGSCKDPFVYSEEEKGLENVPCASGWCGKILETEDALKEEYGTATQRSCLQRGPSDNEERCAYTKVNNKRVYMCFCRGDLCNSSNNASLYFPLLLIFSTLSIVRLLL